MFNWQATQKACMANHGPAQQGRTRFKFSGEIFTPKKRSAKRGWWDPFVTAEASSNHMFLNESYQINQISILKQLTSVVMQNELLAISNPV